MTDELEDRIGSLLTRKADQVGGVPGGELLAGNAERQGRRMKTRRRLLSGLAGLMVLAVAVPVGLNLHGPGEARVEPIESPPPTLTALPAKQSTVEVDLKKLPKGPPPAIPWFADGEIHDGDRTTPVAGADSPPQFYPVANGYVVQVGQQIRLLDTSGRLVADLTKYGKFPSVSSDGRRLATVAGRTATVLDATTGAELYSVRLDGKAGAGVVGFLESSVLLGGTATPLPASLWNPVTGEITPIRPGGLDKLNGRTDGRNRLVVATSSGTCYDVFDVRAGKRLWKLCGAVNPEFTADGRFVVAEKEGTGPLVMDAATGRKLLQVGGLSLMYMPAQSEPGGAMLFVALGKNEPGTPGLVERGASIVRCSLTGQCQVAVAGEPDLGAALPDPSWLFF